MNADEYSAWAKEQGLRKKPLPPLRVTKMIHLTEFTDGTWDGVCLVRGDEKSSREIQQASSVVEALRRLGVE